MKRLGIFSLFAAAGFLLLAQTKDGTFPRQLLSATVAQLAAISSPATFDVAGVTNGASATDCTVGGGSTKVPCFYNGSAWAPLGSAGGGGSQNIIGSANFTVAGGAIVSPTLTGVVTAANYITAGEYSLTLSGVSTANYNTLIQFGNPGGPGAVPAITSPTPTTTLVTFGACQPSTNCGSFVEQSIVNVIITQ